MRKLSLTLIMAFAIGLSASFAQTMEVKINPLAIATSDFKASLEFLTSEKVGWEATAGYNSGKRIFSLETYEEQGFEIGAMAKYYVKPEKENDKLYVGMYGNYGRTNYDKSEDGSGAFINQKISTGFFLGYKWISNKGFFLEAGSGLGRHIMNSNTAKENSSVDVSSINMSNLDIPGRLAIGLRF
jgi:hypothetical protein